MSVPKYPNLPQLRRATLYIRGLHRDIKAAFKAYCAKHGISMTDQIERMMLACIDSEKKRQTPQGAKDVDNANAGSTG